MDRVRVALGEEIISDSYDFGRGRGHLPQPSPHLCSDDDDDDDGRSMLLMAAIKIATCTTGLSWALEEVPPRQQCGASTRLPSILRSVGVGETTQ